MLLGTTPGRSPHFAVPYAPATQLPRSRGSHSVPRNSACHTSIRCRQHLGLWGGTLSRTSALVVATCPVRSWDMRYLPLKIYCSQATILSKGSTPAMPHQAPCEPPIMNWITAVRISAQCWVALSADTCAQF